MSIEIKISIIICVIILLIVLFKFRFLNIIPVAFREIVGNPQEAVLVIDNENIIIRFNTSFHSIFHDYIKIYKGSNVLDFITVLNALIMRKNIIPKIIEFMKDENIDCYEDELELAIPDVRTFHFYMKRIYDRKKVPVGRVISLNDISEHKRLLNDISDKNEEIIAMNEELTAMNDELSAMNEELIAMNERLKDYSETVEELAVAKERNRFASDMHDNLGHTMVLLLNMLKVCRENYETDPRMVKEKLGQSISILKEGLEELRRSIKGLRNRRIECNDLVNSLKNLFAEVQSSGIKVDFSYDDDITCNNPKVYDAIYMLCQEALTNSLKHGKAKSVDVILHCEENILRLYIFDDGKGCGNITKGNGLSGMENRIKAVHGSIIFGSDGEQGFNIIVEVPAS